MRRRTSLGPCVALRAGLATIVLLLSGCGDGGRLPATPKQIAVRLPARTWPERLAVTQDGSLWMTGTYGGITRRSADGHFTEYTIDGDLGTATDIVEGPDGAIWFAAIDKVGRIDRSGRVTTWRVDGAGLADAITATRGALWFTNNGIPARIERLTAHGTTVSFAVRGLRRSLEIRGVAGASDGALWFTQRGYGRDAPDGIGRMTPDGRYTSTPLPRRRAAPTRIAGGSDGALWFTEQDGHAIGRITTAGAVTEFPLRAGLSPNDITLGSDGALWFSADSCIGRITTSGQVTTWAVRGAKRVLGIAAAPDGSFWLADDLANAVRHFTPPPGASAPSVECHPPTITRQVLSTRAALVYRREDTSKGGDFFTGARVHVSRRGKEVFNEVVPRNPRGEPGYGVFGSTSSFVVRDLDGDHEPEVMLELNWNGTHCCDWSRIYRYDASRATYVPMNRWWGNASAAPRLQDLDGDGRPEFLSEDDRFAYDFGGYAGSIPPIQIWSYDHGTFRDVTRRYPGRIRQDAAQIWRLYLRYRAKPHEDIRGILPAWAADEYMLGRGREAERRLEQERRQGYLVDKTCAPVAGCTDGPRGPAAYIEALKALLRKTGYIHR